MDAHGPWDKDSRAGSDQRLTASISRSTGLGTEVRLTEHTDGHGRRIEATCRPEAVSWLKAVEAYSI